MYMYMLQLKRPQNDPKRPHLSNMSSQILANAGYELYPHQVEGIKFMKGIEDKWKKGGILADEVGLGKTIQTIGLILENPGHTLISGPLCVVVQWEQKLKQIMPEEAFTIVVHHGNTRVPDMNSFLESQTAEGKHAIVITSHGLMTRTGTLHHANWDRFILDEAHYARNHKTRIFKRCRSLNARTKWMLSATPVQNKLGDLMSLLQIACQLKGRTKKLWKIKKLRDTFLLRRTKEEIKHTLPPLIIQNKICRFKSEEEEQFYSMVEQSTSHAFNTAIRKNDVDITILELLIRLRQCTLHPQMIIDSYKKKGIFQENLPEWEGETTKIHYMKKIIKKEMEENPDQRTIIFCQFHKEINMIRKMLTEQGFSSEVYSGRTDQDTRTDIVMGLLQPQFLIVQIRAGGAGLNLQEYNRIFITSPDWNPSNEFQAIGRAHRNGQKKPVKVTRLILHWSKKYMKELDEQTKKAKLIAKTLEKDDIERTLPVEQRTILQKTLESFEKKKRNTIDYRIFMIQKEKTAIQANVLDDAFLMKIHKYDVQEMENGPELSSSNYRYLLG